PKLKKRGGRRGTCSSPATRRSARSAARLCAREQEGGSETGVATSQGAPRLVAADAGRWGVDRSYSSTLQILRFSWGHRSGVSCRPHEARRRLGRGALTATGASPAQGGAPGGGALLAGNGLRIDERRELVLELLRSAGAPAVGQVDRHRVGEDLLFTTLDAVEDPLRDRLRSRLRRLEAAHHLRVGRPGQHGVHAHTL